MNLWASSDFPGRKLENYACRLFYMISVAFAVIRAVLLFALNGREGIQQRLIVTFLCVHFGISCVGVRVRVRNTLSDIVIKLLYSEVLNTYFLYQAYSQIPEYKLELCISAFAVIGSFYQIAFASLPWVSVLLMAKQVLLWVGTDILTHPIMVENWFSTSVVGFYIVAAYIMLFHIFITMTRLREEMSNQILEKNQQMTVILESIPEGLFVLSDQQVLLCNQHFYRLFNLTSTDQVYPYLNSIPQILPLVQEFLQKENRHTYFGVIPSKEKQIEWLGSKVTWNNHQAVVITCRDVTELMQLHENASMENERKLALMRSISHELRTPMNYVKQISEDIGCNGVPCDPSAMKVLHSCCDLMNLLVNEIQDFVDATKDSLRLCPERITLSEVLVKCLDMVQPYASGKPLDLTITYDPSLPEHIVTDPGRLCELVVNLLTNAIKYTKTGSVRLIAVTSSCNVVKIMIEDTGMGIEPARIKYLFTCRSSKVLPTSGIGLFMANKIAELLGGTQLAVSSKLGRGSTFTFYVKHTTLGGDGVSRHGSGVAYLLESEEVAEHHSMPIFTTGVFLSSKGSLRTPEVLIVDDFPFNRMVIRSVLEKEGLIIQEAENGSEAIALVMQLHSQGRHFRLIIMDFDMPILDGFACTKALFDLRAKDPSLILPPIIGHSAYTSEEDQRKCFAAGMIAFLPKPCGKPDTLRLVETFLLPKPSFQPHVSV